MDTHKIERFSSCRGVSFEIKPHFDLVNNAISSSKRHWLPWGSSTRITHLAGDLIRRSPSINSSHFCDLEFDDGEDGDTLADIEETCLEFEMLDPAPPVSLPQALPPATSKTRQNSQAMKSSYSRLSVILLDQGLLTVYKFLFVVSLMLNIIGLSLSATGHLPYAKERATLFSVVNIFALTLCRSEAFLRVVFWLVVKALSHSWVPIRIKTMTTSLLQSLGGIHSGCGISSILWLMYSLVLTLKDKDNTSSEIIGIASAILALTCLSSLAAFPLIRHLHHNAFERTHRFAGWLALALLWAFIFLSISYDPKTKSYRKYNGNRLIKQQEFWFTVGITILIVLPWLTVRRVPVKISSPSGHASVIEFQGGVKAGLLGRISPSPFSEWHAFGIISDGKNGHMMLAGAVGDFTKSLVSNPPSHLWVRQLHFAGLPYLINMYNRVLVVATGSGICVFLSFLLQPCLANVCFLWVTKGVEQNFGKKIKTWMSGHPKDKVIVHDTMILGRPNVSQLSVDAAKKWDAQVVVVTSNPEGSRDVVNACKAAGIPAFGPIWDS